MPLQYNLFPVLISYDIKLEYEKYHLFLTLESHLQHHAIYVGSLNWMPADYKSNCAVPLSSVLCFTIIWNYFYFFFDVFC